MQMFYCRFANATWVLLCKYDQQKLENMGIEPNNTHIHFTYVQCLTLCAIPYFLCKEECLSLVVMYKNGHKVTCTNSC